MKRSGTFQLQFKKGATVVKSVDQVPDGFRKNEQTVEKNVTIKFKGLMQFLKCAFRSYRMNPDKVFIYFDQDKV